MSRFTVLILLSTCFGCISTAPFRLPKIKEEVLHASSKMAARKEGRVIDRATIEDINRPIAQYLYEGDIVVSPEQLENIEDNHGVPTLIEMSSLRAERNKRGAPVVTTIRWPKTRPIAFIFAKNISEPVRQKIRIVTSKIAANTCLSFKENSTDGTQIEFHRGSGCWSFLGKNPMIRQPISIGAGCDSTGTILHEISHALGLHHTQSRKDRDDYVLVDIEDGDDRRNIINFEKLSDAGNDNFGVSYDFGSVMHYRAGSFGQIRLIPKDEDYTNTMGQRLHPTFNDYKMINVLYKCSENCPKQPDCQNGGYPNPKNCYVCVCSDFHAGVYCEIPRETLSFSVMFPLTSTPASVIEQTWSIVNTTFHQDYDKTLYNSGNDENWELFGKDAVKIIRPTNPGDESEEYWQKISAQLGVRTKARERGE